MYTSIECTGTVATLLNRDAMLNASVSGGSTILNIGDAYMDRGTNTIPVFETGCTLTVGTENVTVSSVQSSSSVEISPALANGYPLYTPVLRTDYFDVATNLFAGITATTAGGDGPYPDWKVAATVSVANATTTDGYQVLVTVPFATGMKPDFSDVRFAAADDTPLPYTIVSKIDSSVATACVKLGASATQYHLYYGNAGATDASAPASVYDFYDDFEGTTLDVTTRWTKRASATVTVANGYAEVKTSNAYYALYSKANLPDDCVIDLQLYIDSPTNFKAHYIIARDRRYTSYVYSKGYVFRYQTNGAGILYDSSGSAVVTLDQTGDNCPAQTMFARQIRLLGSSISDTNGIAATDTTWASGGIGFMTSGGIPLRIYNIAVRKLTAVEPVCTVGATFTPVRWSPITTTTGTIRIGMEEVTLSSIGVASTCLRCWIDERGANAYPHTEWAPVFDAQYTLDNPQPETAMATYGVIETVDYHHGAMDQNSLDLRALEKLMAATRPQYGKVEMTGMDVWQDATYQYKKDITYYVDTPTSWATVRFHVHTTSGTDSATQVYLNASVQPTWWDIRFATTGLTPYYLATFGTQSATVWIKIRDPATGGATLSLYWGSPIAIDYTMNATPTGYTVATLGTWGAVASAGYDIGDRGYALVREGDPVNVVETDGASRLWTVQGMIYDQRAGTLTMDIGKADEDAISDLVKPFRTLDIVSTKNL